MEYLRFQAEHQIRPSFGAAGTCLDNAVAESFFSILKIECVHRKSWYSRAELEHLQCVEQILIQQLIAEFVVETLHGIGLQLEHRHRGHGSARSSSKTGEEPTQRLHLCGPLLAWKLAVEGVYGLAEHLGETALVKGHGLAAREQV